MSILEAKVQPKALHLENIGITIGKLYTDKGLPPDMALERLTGYTKLEKLSIVDGICQWLIEHKRNSGATDKAIARQRKSNQQSLTQFIDTGEAGIY